MPPYTFGMGLISFENAHLFAVIYGSNTLEFDRGKISPASPFSSSEHDVDTKNYDALKECKEMLSNFPRSNSNV